MNQLSIKISQIVQKYIFEIFTNLIVIAIYIRFTSHDPISTLVCFIACVIVIVVNRFKDNLSFKMFEKK